jgi:hypothetical protein
VAEDASDGRETFDTVPLVTSFFFVKMSIGASAALRGCHFMWVRWYFFKTLVIISTGDGRRETTTSTQVWWIDVTDLSTASFRASVGLY